MYGDQCGEFVCGYWGLKVERGTEDGNHTPDELTCGDFVETKRFNISAPFTRN